LPIQMICDLGTNDVCEILYRDTLFCLDLTKSMTAMGDSSSSLF